MSWRGRFASVAIRNPLRHASGGSLSFCGERKGEKNAAKTKVLGSFPRLRCRPYGKSSATRTKRSSLPPCFRIVSASAAAGRSRGPTLAWRGREGFCVYRAGRNVSVPVSLLPVGADVSVRPQEGKSAKRRQWRMKRAGFEEVPRLAGTTVPVSRLARRWAREPLPYAPQDNAPRPM